MAVIRQKRESNYTVINNQIFEQGHLSFEAIGMLCLLLSKPDNWIVCPAALVKFTEGSRKQSKRDAVYAIINELMEQGYIHRVKLGNGKTEYHVYDYPNTDSPFYGKSVIRKIPITENPDTDNPTLVSTDIKTTTDKKLVSTEKPSVPAKADTQKQFNAIAELYNHVFADYPQIKKIDLAAKATNAKRQKLVPAAWAFAKQRVQAWHESGVLDHEPTGRDVLDWFAGYFTQCATDPFINGDMPRAKGHENWKADFEYMMRMTTIEARVLEAV